MKNYLSKHTIHLHFWVWFLGLFGLFQAIQQIKLITSGKPIDTVFIQLSLGSKREAGFRFSFALMPCLGFGSLESFNVPYQVENITVKGIDSALMLKLRYWKINLNQRYSEWIDHLLKQKGKKVNRVGHGKMNQLVYLPMLRPSEKHRKSDVRINNVIKKIEKLDYKCSVIWINPYL